MVTVQDIGLQLTKPVKELAEWNYPFSQTLETYCSLFNKTCNKSFGEAGLVVQNSTAVYVHRIDCLWNKTEYFRNVFSSYEQEETTKNSTIKKRDRKTDINFQDFRTINFAEEVDKNIDIRKTHMMQNTVKPKSRRFTQLEKGFAQYVPIDIYDVNGEIIGKKYDFRCNQNISMDGILIDEFAPQDFYCDDDNSVQEKSSSTSTDRSGVAESSSLEGCSFNTLAMDSAVHDDSDAESARNDDDSSLEISNLAASFESNQNLSLSKDTDTATLIDVPADITNDNCHDSTLVSIGDEMCTDAPNDTRSPTYNNNSTVTDAAVVLSNNNDSDACLYNNNIEKSIDDLFDSPVKSFNSSRRVSSTGDSELLDDTNEDSRKAKLSSNRIQNTPSTLGCPGNKLRSKSSSKLHKRSPIAARKKGRATKNLLNEFRKKNLTRVLGESMFSQTNGPNMFQKNLSTCIKYIRQYDPLQYNDVTNETLDLLGFRLCANETENANANDNATTTSTDDEMSEFRSSSPTLSPLRESFCDTWFDRSDSPFLPENVDRWHELMQPKLREAEQRSTFCIRDYASRIMESLKSSEQRRISFDDVIRKERSCEVARYFLASLDLASRQNVDINADKALEHNIEIVLHEDERQCPRSADAVVE